jgi:hypothetical protein
MPLSPQYALTHTYDPARVIITYGGMPISGYADGTFVNVEPNAEAWTKKVGADGEVIRARSNDNTHTVTITLQDSSLSNQYLSTCKNADKLTGLGMLPLQIMDSNGATLFFWPQVWVSTDPSWGQAKETTDREWTFHTGQIATQNESGVLL